MVDAFQGSCLMASNSKETFGHIEDYDDDFLPSYKKKVLQNNTYNICCACAATGIDIKTLEIEIRRIENVYQEPLLDTHIYYGWKECKKLGIPYTPPDPNKYNNAG